MKKNLVVAAVLVTAGTGVGFLSPALAQQANGSMEQAEMQAIKSVKLSLVEAVKAAEGNTSGKTVEAQLTSEDGKTGYEITIAASDGSEHNMFVDGSSGKVVKDMPGNDDQGEGE